MAINFIDYDVLEQGKTVYSHQAEAIVGVIEAIQAMNSALEQGWSNETARSFIERINNDHLPKLRNASEAIQEVSEYISNYLLNKADDDKQGANAISG